MSAEPASTLPATEAGDFAASGRLLLLSAFAVLIGVTNTLGAQLLLATIRLFTNLFYFHSFSLAAHSPADSPLGVMAALNPVVRAASAQPAAGGDRLQCSRGVAADLVRHDSLVPRLRCRR
jgi:hypothetical protein